MSRSDADALELLIRQFTQPLAFLRELIQNSLDASTERVDVNVTYDQESRCALVEVSDTGEGMDREIIDRRLTRLFASTKEDDLTKIGKFGIGFVSVFAIKPKAVTVETGRGGEAWRILFRPDRTFERLKLHEPTEGTRVQVFVPKGKKELDKFIRDCRKTVIYWCKHCDVDLRFNGEPVTQSFDLPHPVSVRHLQEGTEVVVAPCTHTRPFHGYYNRGLTLLEGRGSPLPGVAFKIRSRYLEHTLTRDNVLQDKQYQKAMKIVRETAYKRAPQELFQRLETAPEKELWQAAVVVLGYPDFKPRQLRGQKLFTSLTGDKLSLKELDPTVYLTEDVSPLAKEAARHGRCVLHYPADHPVATFLDELGFTALDLDKALSLLEQPSPSHNEEQLLKRLANLTAVARWPRPQWYDLAAAPVDVAVNLIGYFDPRAPVASREELRLPGRGKVLGIHRQHPLVKHLLPVARKEPAAAAYLLARAVCLELRETARLDLTLLESLLSSMRSTP